ncbi:MAG: branched-chain amino acid transport system substrate-binding protein [Hyphomicrobiales bacterium]|jgi:branched-chain amino acid transport system substrate-binding protein|nr:branched-chain amino acid transport system substrate-binding protein [Hyphomicrobiales bacterium]
MKTRRSVIKQGAVLAAGLATASSLPRFARAQGKPVKIAIIVPLSGPWARQGTLVKWGAETAVNEINSTGGVKSMGGAKLDLVAIDAGDSAEKAKNAAQRLIAQEPEVVGGMGAWLSTFTLAITEVTERAQLPWLTLSYADAITNRGFKYVFQSSMPAGKQSIETLPTVMDLAKAATGKVPQSVGIIGDNTASPVAFLKPMREGGLQKAGLKVLLDETYTPPLADATPLIQKVRSTRPDFLFFISTTISDVKLGLEKMNEFRLAKGVIPVIANGAHMGAPEVLKNVPAELIEGLMFSVANWQLKGQDKISDLYKKTSGEPWITQDGLAGYGHTWIIKEALERAGVADKTKVNEEIHKLDLTSGQAADTFPGGVKFDEAGHRINAPVCIVQWQDGKPLTVFPTDRAMATAKWPKTS